MITTGALLHGRRHHLLDFDISEHPVAAQLGGNNPVDLAAAARMCAERGYDEVNLNVGCPSERVQDGEIGACLMAKPHLVANCIDAMRSAVDVEVTVKCRLGIDQFDSDDFLDTFVGTVADAGCGKFYVHARIALLQGLSPAQNRSIPPLRHDRVRALKHRFPQLRIVLNGGLSDVESVRSSLGELDGAMIGRAAYHNPLLLTAIHRKLHDPDFSMDAFTAFGGYATRVRREVQAGTPLKAMTRHVLGLFNGRPGARLYRQILSDSKRLGRNDLSILDDALAAVVREMRSAA
jgi:tRNA-dihydrouridine synthase A